MSITKYVEITTYTQMFAAILKICKEKDIQYKYTEQDYKETQLDTIIIKFTPKTLKILNEACLDKSGKKLLADDDYTTLLKEYKNQVEHLHIVLW